MPSRETLLLGEQAPLLGVQPKGPRSHREDSPQRPPGPQNVDLISDLGSRIWQSAGLTTGKLQTAVIWHLPSPRAHIHRLIVNVFLPWPPCSPAIPMGPKAPIQLFFVDFHPILFHRELVGHLNAREVFPLQQCQHLQALHRLMSFHFQSLCQDVIPIVCLVQAPFQEVQAQSIFRHSVHPAGQRLT